MKWLKKLIDWIMRILFTYRKFTPVKYGLLYNWYAVDDARGLAPSGWHVPSSTEYHTLNEYLGGQLIAGGKLKETGTTYWDSPNTDATNETGFNSRGSGNRSTGYSGIKLYEYLWTTTPMPEPFVNSSYVIRMSYANAYAQENTGFANKVGNSIRLIKDNSTDPGTVIDYDGNKYPTVKIGDQVWMAANLIVRHYSNGDEIPEVTDDDDWAALITGALCAYDNDWDNV